MLSCCRVLDISCYAFCHVHLLRYLLLLLLLVLPSFATPCVDRDVKPLVLSLDVLSGDLKNPHTCR